MVSPPTGGLFNLIVTGSQHRIGNNYIEGLYSATFVIQSSDTELLPRTAISSSLRFTQVWGSLDGTVGYLTKSDFDISQMARDTSAPAPENMRVQAIDTRSVYDKDSVARIRLFIDSIGSQGYVANAIKLPIEKTSLVFSVAYYRVRESFSSRIAIPFERESNATRISSDGKGMYFDLYMQDLEPGRTYEIDVLVNDSGRDHLYTAICPRFRVE